MEELIDVIDENGIKTGVVLPRSEVQAIDFVTISAFNELRKTNKLVDRKEVYDVLAEYLYRI